MNIRIERPLHCNHGRLSRTFRQACNVNAIHGTYLSRSSTQAPTKLQCKARSILKCRQRYNTWIKLEENTVILPGPSPNNQMTRSPE